MFGFGRKKTNATLPRASSAPTFVDKRGRPLQGAAAVTARARAWRRDNVARFLKQGHRDNVLCKVPGCTSRSPGQEYMPLCVDHFRALGDLKYRYWTTIAEDQPSPSPTPEQARWFRAAMERLDKSGRGSRDGGAYAFATMEAAPREAVHMCIWCESCGTWWPNPSTWKHGKLCGSPPMNADRTLKSRIMATSKGHQFFYFWNGSDWEWKSIEEEGLARAMGWKWIPESELLKAKADFERRLARGW